MSYEKSLSIADEMEAEINKEARIVSFHILRGVVLTTPVDTGRARGNWFIDLGKSSRLIDNDRSSSVALRDGASNIEKAKGFSYPTIVINNNLPYIERLNNGHSKQAPAKFVEAEISRVERARIK